MVNLIVHPFRWENYVLILAAFYNFFWGTWVILFPTESFTLFGANPPAYKEIWQCIGMIVGVYGIGYFIAGLSPRAHWPIVLVGLLGKIFGPIGFVAAFYQGVFPLAFGIHIIFNDLIWWIPFILILYKRFSNVKTLELIRISEEDLKNFSERKRAKFINSLSGFKSANLVGTINSKGDTNLSIVSSVFHLGSNPSLIGFIVRPDISPRHTLNNIRENMLCTINHVSERIIKNAHQTSARYDEKESEFFKCGLTETFRSGFEAPFVNESLISMSIKVIRCTDIPENGTHFIVGKIIDSYVPDKLISEDGYIQIEEAGTVCVSGLDSYHYTNRIGRLSYAKPLKPLKWL